MLTSPPRKPLVSVVMPAYNCEDYIQQAIDSILNQTCENFELLIIDDSSTDNTWEKIQSYQDKRIVAEKNTHNIGYLKTTNKLLEKCKGELIAFQDADDWSSKHRLHEQAQLLNNEPNISICGTYCCRVYNKNLKIPIKYPIDDSRIRKQLQLGRTSLFCGSSIMFRRKALEDCGKYREFFDRIGSEDIDWYLRALDSHRGCNIPSIHYFYRQHLNSFTKIKNSNPLKPHSADIALALSLQRRSLGLDSIQTNPDSLQESLSLIYKYSTEGSATENFVNTAIKNLTEDPRSITSKLLSLAAKNILKLSTNNLLHYYIYKKRLKNSIRIAAKLENNHDK